MQTLLTILLASAAVATPAVAQTAPSNEDIAALRAQIEALESKVGELESAQAAKAAAPASTGPKISWRGAPVIEGNGWSFKPRGRLQFDAGYVSSPDGYSNPGLGFSNEIRRARLGAEGKLPGNLGYKFELDLGSGNVAFADAFLSYSTGPWDFIVGQHKNFQGLEELTSSLHTSFLERAAFTDAFGFERRVGISAQWQYKDVLAQAGIFTDNINDLNRIGDRNNSYSYDGRLVYMPKVAGNQLHFGGSAHHRELKDAANSVRYRQRPAIHTTDVRFIDTGNIVGARAETGYGVEAAGIFGPFYLAGEAAWQRVSRDGFPDPTFFGAYLDAGYFFTGESRGYRAGAFDRVRVKKPVDKGGLGALWANARFDHVDLVGEGIIGGKQNAYQLSLNWKPIDHVMFALNYAHLAYDDAAISAGGNRNYSVDVVGLRSQIDF
jgi:phosphate-selective porin OprO and OprP